MTALISFTMDNLSDAADLGRGVISSPRPAGQRPAFEQGYPSLLEMFERYGVRLTHFVEGWNGEAHPDALRDLIRRGHSLGMHGWQHEKWFELEQDTAFRLARQATEALEKASGVRPRAFRAPGGKRGLYTTEMLLELGYEIDASISNSGEGGGEIEQLADSLWLVPYRWETVDATHWLWHERSVEEVEEYWLSLLERVASENTFLVFIWHPHVMGIKKERLAVGERILQYVSRSQQHEIVTLDELIEHHRASATA